MNIIVLTGQICSRKIHNMYKIYCTNVTLLVKRLKKEKCITKKMHKNNLARLELVGVCLIYFKIGAFVFSL